MPKLYGVSALLIAEKLVMGKHWLNMEHLNRITGSYGGNYCKQQRGSTTGGQPGQARADREAPTIGDCFPDLFKLFKQKLGP